MSSRPGVRLLAVCAVALAIAVPARTAAESPEGPTGLVLGLKAGGGIGAPLNDSDPSLAAEVELGYVLPPLDHALEVFAAFAYAVPGMEKSAELDDPRLHRDDVLSYRVEQQIGAPGLGLRYRLHLTGPITPYASVGGRLYMIRTDVSGTLGGEPTGEWRETGSVIGAFLAIGAELALGPGAMLLELHAGYGGLDSDMLGDTNVGMLSLLVGYRFMLPRGPVDSSSAAEREDMPSARVEADADAKAAAAASTRDPAPEPAPAQVEPVAEAADSGAADEPLPTAAEPDAGAQSAQLAPVAAGAAPAPAPAPAMAQVRGNVRDFSGKPLRATIRLQSLGLKVETDGEGRFQIDVPPGRYSIRLRSFGYVSQSREVAVEENGVTVLNVELRKK